MSTTGDAHDPTAAMAPAMEAAFRACVHCGFCLAACPTYRELGQEMDSPRGRIVLMRRLLDGDLSAAEITPHLDRCLGCLACEPACPSGVAYRDLISPVRAKLEGMRRRPVGPRLLRALAGATLPHPTRLRWALRAARVARPLRRIAPACLRPLLDLAPSRLPAAGPVPGHFPASGRPRAHVALLAGCAQQVLAPSINRATIDVLVRNGVSVTVPAGQSCCGALAWHSGDLAAARAFARRCLASFAGAFDAVVTNAAGCGSAMQEYGLVMAGEPEEGAAKAFSANVTDVAAFLERIGLAMPVPPLPAPVAVAYHDACHLSHGQGVRAAPRRLLGAVPGLELREVTDPHLCCGSAGTYNLEQPAIAGSLGRKKAAAVAATRAPLVATGNIGCLVQLRHHLANHPDRPQVLHTIEALDLAYRGALGSRVVTGRGD
jgi:glycolate oxidase iron-sulfur subunit